MTSLNGSESNENLGLSLHISFSIALLCSLDTKTEPGPNNLVYIVGGFGTGIIILIVIVAVVFYRMQRRRQNTAKGPLEKSDYQVDMGEIGLENKAIQGDQVK